MLGTILELQGKKDDAKARYNKALQSDPRAAVAANNLAWLDANSNGNLDVALQLAQTAKAALPNQPEVNDTLGWIYYRKGLIAPALTSLRESVATDANNPTSTYHLALAYQQNGAHDLAARMFDRARALAR